MIDLTQKEGGCFLYTDIDVPQKESIMTTNTFSSRKEMIYEPEDRTPPVVS